MSFDGFRRVSDDFDIIMTGTGGTSEQSAISSPFFTVFRCCCGRRAGAAPGEVEAGLARIGPIGRPIEGYLLTDCLRPQARSTRRAGWYCKRVCVGLFIDHSVMPAARGGLGLVRRGAGWLVRSGAGWRCRRRVCLCFWGLFQPFLTDCLCFQGDRQAAPAAPGRSLRCALPPPAARCPDLRFSYQNARKKGIFLLKITEKREGKNGLCPS